MFSFVLVLLTALSCLMPENAASVFNSALSQVQVWHGKRAHLAVLLFRL